IVARHVSACQSRQHAASAALASLRPSPSAAGLLAAAIRAVKKRKQAPEILTRNCRMFRQPRQLPYRRMTHPQPSFMLSCASSTAQTPAPMNWTSRQLISFIRDHRSTLPHSYALRTARPGLAPDSFCLTKAETFLSDIAAAVRDLTAHRTAALAPAVQIRGRRSRKPQAAQRHPPSRPEPSAGPAAGLTYRPDSFRLAHPRQHQLPHQPLQFATPPKRSDSMPSPSSQPLPLCLPATLSRIRRRTTATPPAAVSAASSSSSAVVAQGGDEADIGTDGSRAAALQDGYDQVPAEDFAREITLMFLPVFTAIQPDELTSVAWHGRDKELRAQMFLSNRATVLAHFIKIAKKLYELQNLHGTFAVVAALQSQPIFRLKKTWSSLPRKHVEAFERLSDLFSANSNTRDCAVSCRTSGSPTGGLESQARKDKMNNICRVLSDYQQSQYSFQSKEHVRRYLEGQTYIEEMQSFVEAANYKTSRDLEPHDSGGSGGGGLVAASGAGIHQHDSLAAARRLRAGPPGPSGQSGLRLQDLGWPQEVQELQRC
uniref:Ras-GEF domain-containing protein n=1 Tax=Macrostomum lignano TaxID=282301 RepID=A0A1I8F6N4_9PLAT